MDLMKISFLVLATFLFSLSNGFACPTTEAEGREWEMEEKKLKMKKLYTKDLMEEILRRNRPLTKEELYGQDPEFRALGEELSYYEFRLQEINSCARL